MVCQDEAPSICADSKGSRGSAASPAGQDKHNKGYATPSADGDKRRQSQIGIVDPVDGLVSQQAYEVIDDPEVVIEHHPPDHADDYRGQHERNHDERAQECRVQRRYNLSTAPGQSR